MNGRANLERGYGRLLAWYPRAFRRDNGQELLAVLMANAPDGQRRPGLAESANLIWSGLWMRLRPSGPRPARTVRAAVGLMIAGAAVSTASLVNSLYAVIVLASIDDNKLHHVHLPELSGVLQVPAIRPLAVALGFARDLVMIALWLWMARAAAQRRNWARTAATALCSLATLDVCVALAEPRLIGLTGGMNMATVLALTWPVGAAAVCLLWCPASTAFFRRPDQPAGFPPGPALPGGDSTRTDRS